MIEETSQDAGGLRPLYQSYKHQKCFVGHSHEAPWYADIVSACEETMPEFRLEPWYAAHNFDPTRPLRDKVVEMIANARYGIYDLSYWRRDNKGEWEMPRNVLIELGMAIVLNRPTLLLQHAECRRLGPKLPECLESVSEYILEFSGESSLKRVLRERLPQWVNAPPQRDWWNRYCIFGSMQCRYREAHPRAERWGQEKLHCHISDGFDVDRLDFREVVGKVLERFNDVEFNYLDKLPMTSGYNFLLCTHCQTIRSTPFAIYRITPETACETFIAIGMSIALEKQFEYKIPKILLTANMEDVPSLLAGYEVVVAQNDHDRKNRLREYIPVVIQKVRETTWKPRPLPFVEVIPQLIEKPIVANEQEFDSNDAESSLQNNRAYSFPKSDPNHALRKVGHPARLVIADSHELARAGLQAMFSKQRGLELVGVAVNGSEALELCRGLQPDLALLEMHMSELDGIAACRAIKQECPATSVILMTVLENPAYLLEAFKAGADGYMLKNVTQKELIKSVRRVLRGESILNKELVTRLLEHLDGETPGQAQLPQVSLSPRELEVLLLLTQGQTNREIAQNLIVSVSTVKIHVEHILAKLGVSDRTQGAVRAIELGLLDTESSNRKSEHQSKES